MTSITDAPTQSKCYSDPNWESLSNLDILPKYRYDSCSQLEFDSFDNCVNLLGEQLCVPLHQEACTEAISAWTSISAEDACCECGGGVEFSQSPSISPSATGLNTTKLSIPIIAGAAGGGLFIGILITFIVMKSKSKRRRKKKKRHHNRHEDHTPNKHDVSKAWEIAASRARKHNKHHSKEQKEKNEFGEHQKIPKEERQHREHRKKVDNHKTQNDSRDKRETFIDDDYKRRKDIENQYPRGPTIPGFHGGRGISSRFDEMMTNSIRHLFQNR